MAHTPGFASTPAFHPALTGIVQRSYDKFIAVYRQPDIASALGLWIETFYRRPHPQFVPGALLDMLRTPGAGIGHRSLPTAVFLSEIFRKICTKPSEAQEIIGHMIVAQHMEGFLAGGSNAHSDAAAEANEKMDTVLRGLWLANTPECDEVLKAAARRFQGAVSDAAGADDDEVKLVAALAQSLYPADGQRQRGHILHWPIPFMNLPLFEKTLKEQTFPVYGCTRYWFMHTHAMHGWANSSDKAQAGRVAVTSPQIAQALTMSMVDSYWHCFYATGNQECVERVLDVGTVYAAEFLEDYGPEWFTQYHDNVSPKNASNIPEEFREDPYSLMRFETSRYALHTFLQHLATHAVVADCYAAHYSRVVGQTSLTDPFGTQNVMTSFGNQRIKLLKFLLPLVQELCVVAATEGIGSGKYPASFALLDDGHVEAAVHRKLLDDGGMSAHHDAPAITDGHASKTKQQEAVQQPVQVPAASSIADNASRDPKRITLTRRKHANR